MQLASALKSLVSRGFRARDGEGKEKWEKMCK
jgi:hypothetical protein